MSFYFRDRPRFSDKLRGKSGDELLQEIKQQFDEDSKSFFEPSTRSSRDPLDRHAAFSRGFPFDDDGFGRRSDIRAHLDDLAARHPEFADHLLGPPWGDIPFHGSLRNRRRGSGSGNSYQSHPDDDARSQASGSSAASAASGASGVSSRGEPEGNQQQQQERSRNFEQDARKSQIPQYGFRNTVDIGQHRHNMDNPDKGNRGQRSMSAPPENRQSCFQQPEQQPQQSQQPQGQRFVSRVDITPQHNQPQQPQQPPQQPQQPPQQPQQTQQTQQPSNQQQQSNVRHIPIFVEGRDKPVIPRNVDETFRREPSPPQFHAPPHFQRQSPFGQHFGGRHHQWSPHFQDPFYPQPGSFEQPQRRQQQTPNYRQPRQQQYTDRQRPEPQQQQYYEQPKQQRQQQPHPQQQSQPQPQPQPQPQQQQHEQQQEQPKPKVVVPKDPLERVALVQKEVDSLAEEVKRFTGNSRQDKEYIYLDEMLTRELIKLDDIETEGRDNVRQARRNAIKTIQDTIGLLESKAPIASRQQSQDGREVQGDEASKNTGEAAEESCSMEVDQKQEETTQFKEPIPLPPGPSSPTKESTENEAPAEQTEEAKNLSNDQTAHQVSRQQTESKKEQPSNEESMDTTPAEKVEPMPMETQGNAENSAASTDSSEEKRPEEKVAVEKKPENTTESQKPAQEGKPSTQEKMEVESEVKKSPKTPKKGKRAKKQIPVSEQPIPLPPPGPNETNAK